MIYGVSNSDIQLRSFTSYTLFSNAVVMDHLTRFQLTYSDSRVSYLFTIALFWSYARLVLGFSKESIRTGVKKAKFATRFRAVGLELILVYRQSALR